MPVVPAVVPPPPSFRDGSSRPITGARRGGCAVREGREPRARMACRARAGIARATWRGHRGVAGRCRAARPKERSARRPGCRLARRVAPGWWGMRAPTTRASASGWRPGAARATWRAGWGQGRGAAMPRERHHERGALAGGDRTTWARGHHAGAVGPGESAIREARPAAARREPHEVAGMPPTGARRQRPPGRRGDAAVVTDPYGAAILKLPATPGDLYFSIIACSPGTRCRVPGP